MNAGESATRCSYNDAGGDKRAEEATSRSDRMEGALTVETGYICLGGTGISNTSWRRFWRLFMTIPPVSSVSVIDSACSLSGKSPEVSLASTIFLGVSNSGQ
jgi:myosin-crossreactive antigen